MDGMSTHLVDDGRHLAGVIFAFQKGVPEGPTIWGFWRLTDPADARRMRLAGHGHLFGLSR